MFLLIKVFSLFLSPWGLKKNQNTEENRKKLHPGFSPQQFFLSCSPPGGEWRCFRRLLIERTDDGVGAAEWPRGRREGGEDARLSCVRDMQHGEGAILGNKEVLSRFPNASSFRNG